MRHAARGPRRAARCALPVLFALAVASSATVAVPHQAGAAQPAPPYVPPVEAPVLDPFRPPEHPYGPGNRGLQYATEAGTEVRAVGDGRVTFAGLVAGTRHVTVLHTEGLRTSYSFLDRVDVVVGQRVRQGDVVGTTAGRLHLGARIGDAYLDPASLFDAGPPRVHLVPFEDPPGAGPSGERNAIGQLIGGIGGALGGVLGGAADVGAGLSAWLRGEGSQLARTLAHYAWELGVELSPSGLLARGYQAVTAAWVIARRPCTRRAVAVAAPAAHRVAVLVGGLGSSSESAAIDDVPTGTLGYEPVDVVRFSYAGGRTPDAADGFASIGASRYTAADTQGDLRAAGARLADLVEAVVSARRGATVDLLAHSQGGLVARLALIELERRHGSAWLARLGLVATIGTPHRGADLATGVHALGATLAGSMALDGVQGALDLALDDDATSLAQLAETSRVVAELAAAPVPVGVRALSIAARGDLVVPVPSTRLDGATNVVVPLLGLTAHDRLPGSPEVQRELSLALAGLPPTCQGFGSALADQVVGEAISKGEDAIGALAFAAAAAMAPPLGG